jgi:hypothetical protein
LFADPIVNNPLVLDYVVKEDRGAAVSLTLMGLSLGVILSLSVLFEVLKDLDPSVSWTIMSVMFISLGIVLLFILKEPEVVKTSE